jgi:hypothetical protein
MKKTIITILLLICAHTYTVNAQRLRWDYYQSPGGTPCQTNYNNPVVYTNTHTCNQYCRHATSTTFVTERPQCQPVIYISQPSVTIVISPKKYYKKRRPISKGIVKKYVYRDSDEYIYEEEVYREVTP